MRFAKGLEETCVAMTLGNRAISVMGLARFAKLESLIRYWIGKTLSNDLNYDKALSRRAFQIQLVARIGFELTSAHA
jgi:hypothetical protein